MFFAACLGQTIANMQTPSAEMQSAEYVLKIRVVKPEEKESNRKMIIQVRQNGVCYIFNLKAAL